MRLRQVVIATRELEPTVEAVRDVLGLEVGFRDPDVAEFGLVNAVFPVGESFLEVIAPVAEDAPVRRFLARQGEGGYMLIFQTRSLEEDRRRFAELGARVIWKADFPEMSGTHLHPRDIGGAIVSVDEARPPESWRWAGPDWRSRVRTDVVRGVAGATLESPDAESLAYRWGEVLDVPVRQADRGFELLLEEGTVRMVPATSEAREGVVSYALRAADPARALARARAHGLEVDGRTLTIAGTRIDLV